MTRTSILSLRAWLAAFAAALAIGVAPALAQTADPAAADDSAADAQAAESTEATADAAAPDATADAHATTEAAAGADAQPATTADTNAAADATASDAAAVDAQAAADATATPPTGAAADANAQLQGQAGAATDADLQTQPQADLPGQANVQGQADLQGQINGQSQAGLAAGANQPLDASRLGLQLGPATAAGLTINAIERNSVFLNSGLRPRDVLVTLSGQPIRSFVDFQRYLVQYPGQRIPLVVLRNGQRQTVYFTPPVLRDLEPGFAPGMSQAFLGVTLDVRYSNAAIVLSVAPGGPAERAGLRAGDMIHALNGRRVSSPQHVTQTIATMEPGAQVAIDFSRRVNTEAVAVLANRPAPVPQTVGYAPQPVLQPAPPASIPARVGVTPVIPDNTFVPATPRGRLNDGVRPADADGDGRIFDGDGRLRGPR